MFKIRKEQKFWCVYSRKTNTYRLMFFRTFPAIEQVRINTNECYVRVEVLEVSDHECKNYPKSAIFYAIHNWVKDRYRLVFFKTKLDALRKTILRTGEQIRRIRIVQR